MTWPGSPTTWSSPTKPDLAIALIRPAVAAGVRAQYVTVDEVYGSVAFRTACRALGLSYVAAIPANRPVTTPDHHRRTGTDLVTDPGPLMGPDAHRQRNQRRQGLRLGPARRPARRCPRRPLDTDQATGQVVPQPVGHSVLLVRRHRYTRRSRSSAAGPRPRYP